MAENLDMGTNSTTPGESAHPYLPNFLRGLLISGGVGVVALIIYFHFFAAPSPAEKQKQTHLKIEQMLGEATDLFDQEDYAAAAQKFRQARDLARAERLGTLTKGQSREHQPKEYRFSILDGHASYRLAATMMLMLETRYAQEFAAADRSHGRPFVPPGDATETIRTEIMSGLEANPGEKYLYHLLGRLDNMTRRHRSAIKALQKAIDLDEDFAEAYNDLGVTYANPLLLKSVDGLKYRERATASFQMALAISRNQGKELPDAHFNLGLMHDSLSQYFRKEAKSEKAKEHRAKAVEHLKSFLEITKKMKNPPPGVTRARQALERK